MERLIVSVLVVNWNTKEHLRRCLKALLEAGDWGLRTGEADFEVIVVDNASIDGSAEMVRNEFPQVKLVANERNIGYAAANNQAAMLAKGRYFLLLNPDTELSRETIDKLVAFAETHPDAGAIAPKLVYPDGHLQPSVRSFPTPAALLFSALALDKLFATRHSQLAVIFGRYRMTWFSYDEVAEVDQPMSSALLVRREAWEQVGGMDETMPIFFNDVDFCWRLKKSGWRIYFLPDATVVHHHGASTRLLGIGKALATHKGLLRFYDKHIRPLLPPPLYWLLRTFVAFGSFLRIAALLAANFFMLSGKRGD